MTEQQRAWTIERLRAANPQRAHSLDAAFTVADRLGLWVDAHSASTEIRKPSQVSETPNVER